MTSSERRTGVLIGVGLTIGVEIVVMIALAIGAFMSLRSNEVRTTIASMRHLRIQRDERLTLYADEESIPFESLQIFIAKKMSQVGKSDEE